MERSILPEYECLICLDLLIEPCTTMCGHSFCKACISRFLETNHNCPTCRKPIFQTKETLSKSFILENIIKAKYPQKYEEGLKSRLVVNTEQTTNQFQIPFIQLENTYIWPLMTKTIKILPGAYYNTLNIASLNDRRIVIVPSTAQILSGTICSLCEITNLSTIGSTISASFKGIKRFKLLSSNANGQQNDVNFVFVSTGEIVADELIAEDEAKADLYNKLTQINQINEDLLKRAPITFVNALNRQYGKCPTVPFYFSQVTQTKLEELSLFFLNIIKTEQNIKLALYESKNLTERINWYIILAYLIGF